MHENSVLNVVFELKTIKNKNNVLKIWLVPTCFCYFAPKFILPNTYIKNILILIDNFDCSDEPKMNTWAIIN